MPLNLRLSGPPRSAMLRTTGALALLAFTGTAAVHLVSATPLAAQLRPVVAAGDPVRIGAIIQPVWHYRGESDAADLQGFFLRRARLDVTGEIMDGNVHFRLLPDLARSPELRDAWVEVRGTHGGEAVPAVAAGIRMGQQTVPFDLQRERSMNAGHFGERSIASRRFELSGGRDVGVMGYARAREGRIHLYGGAFNGLGANRRDPGRSPLLGGRAIVSLGGSPARGESDIARTASPVVSLGAGAMGARNSQLRPRPGFASDRVVDWHSWTADLHLRWLGTSVAASWFEQHIDVGGNDERGEGFFVSAGWVVPGHDLEFVARHSRATWDLARDAGPETEQAVGVTFFHRGHELQTRFQLSRERLAQGSPDGTSTLILTIEHQLLLGG
ncbi:MAG: hypothetical protein EA350_13100 [Gemmatimonadales bacterium]|nr:MAG: hypothetical protein EA350_13100 [Gemmatimonadales bacterium]